MKIVVLGASGSGKSALIDRLVNNRYRNNLLKYTGEICSHRNFDSMTYGHMSQYFWDMNSQEQSLPIFLLTADVILCLFALSDKKAIEKLKSSILDNQEIRSVIKDKPEIFCLIGTKADLPRAINQDQIELLKDETGIKNYFGVSANTVENIITLNEFINHAGTMLFTQKSEQRKRLIGDDLISKQTKKKNLLEQARNECGRFWADGYSELSNIRAILDDYALNNNGYYLWFNQHANRHHTFQVSRIVRKIDLRTLRTTDEVLDELEKIQNIRSNGSLNLRLVFIKEKLGKLDEQDLNDALVEPQLVQGSNWGCRVCWW